jgi:hypothetical protein
MIVQNLRALGEEIESLQRGVLLGFRLHVNDMYHSKRLDMGLWGMVLVVAIACNIILVSLFFFIGSSILRELIFILWKPGLVIAALFVSPQHSLRPYIYAVPFVIIVHATIIWAMIRMYRFYNKQDSKRGYGD